MSVVNMILSLIIVIALLCVALYQAVWVVATSNPLRSLHIIDNLERFDPLIDLTWMARRVLKDDGLSEAHGVAQAVMDARVKVTWRTLFCGDMPSVRELLGSCPLAAHRVLRDALNGVTR